MRRVRAGPGRGEVARCGRRLDQHRGTEPITLSILDRLDGFAPSVPKRGKSLHPDAPISVGKHQSPLRTRPGNATIAAQKVVVQPVTGFLGCLIVTGPNGGPTARSEGAHASWRLPEHPGGGGGLIE